MTESISMVAWLGLGWGEVSSTLQGSSKKLLGVIYVCYLDLTSGNSMSVHFIAIC